MDDEFHILCSVIFGKDFNLFKVCSYIFCKVLLKVEVMLERLEFVGLSIFLMILSIVNVIGFSSTFFQWFRMETCCGSGFSFKRKGGKGLYLVMNCWDLSVIIYLVNNELWFVYIPEQLIRFIKASYYALTAKLAKLTGSVKSVTLMPRFQLKFEYDALLFYRRLESETIYK